MAYFQQRPSVPSPPQPGYAPVEHGSPQVFETDASPSLSSVHKNQYGSYSSAASPQPGYAPVEHGSPHIYEPDASPSLSSVHKNQYESYSNAAPPDSSFNNAPYQIHEINHNRKRSLKTSMCMIMSLVIGLLWIGPAVYLLYLNISGSVIGASAWCPGGKCNVISYYSEQNETTAVRAAKADKENHDLLGGLQLTAKAMEIWFVAIAGSLVFTLSRILAQKPGGLPIGYLLTHLEIGDPRLLLNLQLFTSPRSKRPAAAGEKKQHVIHLYSFGLLAVAMCVVCNLMGPSVAVMMIPTLDWKFSDKVGVGRFGRVLSDKKPSFGVNDKLPGCTEEDLMNGLYNCTGTTYIDTMDAIVESSLAALSNNATGVMADEIIWFPTIENMFPFSFNYTAEKVKSGESMAWAPNRQVIRGMANDFDRLAHVVLGQSEDEQYLALNNSLGLEMHRDGPIIGAGFWFTMGYKTVTKVDDDRWINCFTGYTTDNAGNSWNKCMRAGSGWNSTFSQSSFTIAANNETESSPEIYVESTFYWSDASTYWKGNFNDAPSCFKNGTLSATERKDCDYAALFARALPSELAEMEERPRASDGFIMEWTAPLQTNVSSTIVTEMYPAAGVAGYMVDVTEVMPSPQEVQVPLVPDARRDNLEPIVIHADWALATWGGQDGTNWPSRRPAALEVRSHVNDMMAGWDALGGGASAMPDDWNNTVTRCANVALVTNLQMLSMITFDSTSAAPANAREGKLHPILNTRVRRRVWKFGLSSRTSHMGIVILICGCLTVLARSVLLVIAGMRNPSTVDLVVSGLEHSPRGEFDGTKDENDWAKVRFRVLAEDGPVRRRITWEKQ